MSTRRPVSPRILLWFLIGHSGAATANQFLPIGLALVLGGSFEQFVANLALLYAAQAGISALSAMLSGVLVDRRVGERLLLLADALRMMLLGAFIVVFVDARASLWVGMVLVGALGGLDALVRPAVKGILVQQVSPELRQRYLGHFTSLYSTSRVIGPAAAAVLAPLVGAVNLLWLNQIGFLAGIAATLLLLPYRRETRLPDQRAGPLLQEAVEGVRAVLGYPWLRWLFLADVLHLIVPVAAWLLLLQALAESRWGAGTQGFILAAFACGGLVGGAVAGRWQPVWSGPAIVVSQWLFVLPLAMLAVDVPLAVMVGAAVVGGMGNELNSVWLDTALSRRVPARLIGRILSSVFVVSMIFLPLGYVISGWLLQVVAPSMLLVWSAVALTVASGLALSARSVRSLRDYRRPSPATSTPPEAQ